MQIGSCLQVVKVPQEYSGILQQMFLTCVDATDQAADDVGASHNAFHSFTFFLLHASGEVSQGCRSCPQDSPVIATRLLELLSNAVRLSLSGNVARLPFVRLLSTGAQLASCI